MVSYARNYITTKAIGVDSANPDALKHVNEAFARLFLLKDYLSKLSNQKAAVLWGGKQGVEKTLRERFAPLPELNMSVAGSRLEDYFSMYCNAQDPVRAIREDFFERDQLLSELRWEAEGLLYGHLKSFLWTLNKSWRAGGIDKIISAWKAHDEMQITDDALKALLSKHEHLLSHDQIALDQANLERKRLCKFCWRPVEPGSREQCCQHHSQLRNPGGYKRAQRSGMSTPDVLAALFSNGELVKDVIIPCGKCDACQNLPALEQMLDNWSKAVSSGLAQSFIEKLAGNTYRELKHATEYSTWDVFFDDLCRAFEVTMPDDVVFLAHALPHAIAEVKREQERFAKKAKAASIAKEVEELAVTDITWGAQRRTAELLNISDATMSKRLKCAKLRKIAA